MTLLGEKLKSKKSTVTGSGILIQGIILIILLTLMQIYSIMPQNRELAAIMFTDIQGYTAMMQHDEELTIQIRARHRKIFNATTKKFNGNILQYFGDGTLSTFRSAIDAVKCAMEMQKEFQKQPVVPVRIGIHLGDIVITDDDIIGDGVNVASRIESLAVPGSVFISDKVYEEIKNQVSIETQSLSTFEFKNVDKPIEVFAIANKGLVIPHADKIEGKTKQPGLQSSPDQRKLPSNFSKWIFYTLIGIITIVAVYFIVLNIFQSDVIKENIDKSIAILPFVNMTSDPEQEYFSDGITEDIITHLSKIADLRVVSRTSTLQYKNTTKTIPEIGNELGVSNILEGSVRISGDQIRITAQLINAKTDEHIWAETYDRELEEIFDIQTNVAKEILRVLKAKLTQGEEKNLEKSVTSEISAYDYYLRGKEALDYSDTQKDYELAAELFQEAINVDPEFASAYVGLAWTMSKKGFYGAREEVWKDSAILLNQKALDIDPNLDEAHFFRGKSFSWTEDWENAKKAFEKVLALNPNHAQSLIELGDILMQQNKLEEGMELIVDGITLSIDKKEPDFYLSFGNVYYEIGELAKAKLYFNQALKLKPDYYRAYYTLVEISLVEKDYPKALFFAKKIVEIERNAYSLDRLGWAYMLVKDYPKAIATWKELGVLIADFDLYYSVAYKHRLGYVLWNNGQIEEAKKLFDEQIQQNLEILDKGLKKDILGEAYDLAGIYAFLGEKKEAYRWLDKTLDIGFLPSDLADRDPMFDNIRNDTKFKEILSRQIIKEERNKPRFELIREKLKEYENSGILSL